MPKHLFDYTPAEFDIAIGILNEIAKETARTYIASVKEHGICDRRTLNAHDHTEHVGNALLLVKKCRDAQAGVPHA